MKRKELVTGVVLTAAITGAALTFTGCGFERPEAVYGPPPEVEYDPAEEEIEDVYGPPPMEEEPEEYEPDAEYDPSYEEVEAVYGPPPDYYDSAEPVTPSDGGESGTFSAGG